jgi:hypothetical protein
VSFCRLQCNKNRRRLQRSSGRAGDIMLKSGDCTRSQQIGRWRSKPDSNFSSFSGSVPLRPGGTCAETTWRARGEFLRGGTVSSNPSSSSGEFVSAVPSMAAVLYLPKVVSCTPKPTTPCVTSIGWSVPIRDVRLPSSEPPQSTLLDGCSDRAPMTAHAPRQSFESRRFATRISPRADRTEPVPVKIGPRAHQAPPLQW